MFEEIIPVTLNNGYTINTVLGYTNRASANMIVILFSPHPLLGGDIENNVITTLFNQFISRNYITIRFSYRGVDTGEINGENYLAYWDKLEQKQDFTAIMQDTYEVLTSIVEQINPDARKIFVPYSFGNIIALGIYDRIPPVRFVGIAPPVNDYDISKHLRTDHNAVFVVAKNDPFCDCSILDTLNVSYTICDVRDHFFRGYEQILCDKITQLVEV